MLEPDPPANCHLNVKKNAKNLTFFQKILTKIVIFFQQNCQFSGGSGLNILDKDSFYLLGNIF